MRVLRHTALASVTALVIALAAPGQAETTTTVSPPYTRGQYCGYGGCTVTPPPNGYRNWNLEAVAEPARRGELVVGSGWASRAASMVEFWSPSTVGPISASAQIAGLNVSSPYEIGIIVCLKIIDLGPQDGSGGGYGGGGVGFYPADKAVDCHGKSTPFRALSATASSVPANHKIRIEVSLDGRYNLGVARATVSSISYTLP